MQLSKLVLYIGKHSCDHEFFNWKDIQKYIADDRDNGGHNLSREEIETALDILTYGEFLTKGELLENVYTRKTKNFIIENKIVQAIDIATACPLYFAGVDE